MKTLVTSLLLSVSVSAFTAPAYALDNGRMAAIELCAARTTADLGAGKVRIIRSKALRKGHRINIIKMDASGENEQARIRCKVSDGEITAFEVKQSA